MNTLRPAKKKNPDEMARRSSGSSGKLPAFKVSLRSSTGRVSRRSVRRGCQGVLQLKSFDGDTVPSLEVNKVLTGVQSEHTTANDSEGEVLPTLHEISQKKSTESWERIRKQLLRTCIESEALPQDTMCSVCGVNEATHRCLQCSSVFYFCLTCFSNAHCKTNLFHKGEIWENGMFKSCQTVQVIDMRNHDCSSTRLVPLTCISGNGEEHEIKFTACTCEPLVTTMVRARLWPSSSQRPQFAFSFEFLNWAEALLLEAQVSLHDFSKAVGFKCRHLLTKGKEFYAVLIDCFEEYRWLKVELRQLSLICPGLDKGNVCPACPKESGVLVISADALFGLPRKKAAGISHRNALHGSVFFGDQSEVDEYVASYNMTTTKVPKVCSTFLAGDSLRSSKRYHALDETALFGVACRHEFPLFFINLKHGERLSYIVWLLHNLIQRIPALVEIHVMYDIACTLVQHLKNSRDGGPLLERVQFSLPSFHAYGHKASCQALFSPLHSTGVGLSDGEVMERMWSILRRFSRMTKEMRPAHRVDVLTHALLYYGLRVKYKLPKLLGSRWIRATELHKETVSAFQQLRSTLSSTLMEPLSDVKVEQWIVEYRKVLTDSAENIFAASEWKCSYFVLLQSYYLAREEMIGTSGVSIPITSAKQRIASLESQLKEMEVKYNIQSRWDPGDCDYQECKVQYLKEKEERAYTAMWSCVVKRHYLLRMKAKYADGQKIAKKLSTSISKETRAAKRLLDEYVAAAYEIDKSKPLPSVQEVLSLNSDFWMSRHHVSTSDSIPWKTKEELVQTYLLIKRCEEEKSMLTADMISTLKYWQNHVNSVTSRLEGIGDQKTQYEHGLQCVLQRSLLLAEFQHHRAANTFSRFIQVPNEVLLKSTKLSDNTEIDSDSSDESDSDSDSE